MPNQGGTMNNLYNVERDKYFSEFPEIETERFYLKKFKNIYLSDLSQMMSDKETMKYSGMKIENAIELAQFYVNKIDNLYKNKKGLKWAILNKSTGNFTGEIGFYNIDLNANHTELGYTINRIYWRQGVATECINELTNFAFNKLGMSEILLLIADNNYKSINLAKKLNFQQGKTVKCLDHDINPDAPETMTFFSKLKQDIIV